MRESGVLDQNVGTLLKAFQHAVPRHEQTAIANNTANLTVVPGRDRSQLCGP